MNTPMPPFDDPDDARLHAALRALPEHRAPDTLIPGVLAAIRAREHAATIPAPWYHRPATTWPPALRIALGTIAMAVVTALAFIPQLLGIGGETASAGSALARAWDTVLALLGAVRTILSACATAVQGTAGTHWLVGGAAVMFFSYLVLLGIGGAIWRTASQPRQHRSVRP